jgi:hypothetical protein
VRALPDSEVPDLQKNAIAAQDGKPDAEKKAEEAGGEVYNLEISFAYNAAPSKKGISGKARNMHMEIVFYAGVKGLFGLPIRTSFASCSLFACANSAYSDLG